MPVLVDAIKAAVLAAHPEAVVHSRTLNGIKHAIAPLGGRERFVLDTAIGHYHYYDAGSPVEINTDWGNETGSWVDGNHASSGRILSGTTGTRRLYPRRDHMDEYVEFARPQYWTGAAWANITLPARTRTGDTVTWDATAFAISVVLTGCQVKLSVTLKTAAAAKRIRWPITLTGLTRTGWQLFSGTTVVCDIPQPTLVDAAGTERVVEAYIRNGAVEFIADVTGLTYPVVIDPPLDYQVGAAADDWWARDGDSAYFGTSGWAYSGDDSSGNYDYRSGFRFTGVAVSVGATIDVAYLSLRAKQTKTVYPATKIIGEAADNPTAPTSLTTFAARTRTDASAPWTPVAWVADTWYNSPSTVAVIQEIIGRGGWASGNAINQFWQVAVTGWGGTANIVSAWDYDAGAASAAKLHIEYTAAATGFKHYLSLLGVGR
jgi:hypothetical protein